MAAKFLELASYDAIGAFVDAKLAGASDPAAGQAARDRLEGSLRAAFDAAPSVQRWKPLALPLADLAADGDGLQLPLVAPASKHVARAGGWTWTLEADASMTLVADVLDAGQMATLGLPPREGHQLVRYAVMGELGAAAAGGATAGAWSARGAVSGSARAAVEWYIAAPSHRRLGQALREALPFMAPPMSLADQLERAGDFEYWGSTVQLGGELSASFSASASMAQTGWTWGFDGDRAQLGFTLGLSGSASLRLAGDFRLRCLVKPAGTQASGAQRFGVEVTLERVASDSRSLALALTAGVDATALARSADRWLRSHLPDPTQIDAALEGLTNPGTALDAKLRSALTKALSAAKCKDLVLLAAGFGDAKALAASLAERVAEPLMDEIDRLAGALDDADPAALADRWLARAFGGLPIPAEARTRLARLASEQLADAKSQVDGALAALAARLETRSAEAAAGLLAPLATLGEKIQAQLQGVAAAISGPQASAAVRQGLADYARLRQQVLAALGDAQRAKISLALAGTLEQTQRSQAFFRATFVPAADLGAGERLFRALWSGRLDTLPALLADAQASGVIAGEAEGWLLRASRRVAAQSITIQLLGVSITRRITQTSELKLQADMTGKVLASGQAGAQDEAQNYWTERHAVLRMSALRSGSAAQPTVEFAFNGAYSARGRDIDPDQFNAMQRTLARVAGGSGTIDIRALLGGPDGHSMDDKAFRRNVAFLLPIALQPGEFDAFLDADSARLQASLLRFGLRALDAEFEGRWDEPPSRFLQGLAQALDGHFAQPEARLLAYLERFPTRWQRRASAMDSAVYERLGLDPGDMRGDTPLHRQLGTLFRLACLLRAILSLQEHARALRGLMCAARLDGLAEVERDAFQRMQQVTAALANFSVAGTTLIGNDENVSWPFASFAACLAQAVGRPVPPGFVACAVPPGPDAQPIPLIAA